MHQKILNTILCKALLLALIPLAPLCSQNETHSENIEQNQLPNASDIGDSLVLSLQENDSDQDRLNKLNAICKEMVSTNAEKCIVYGKECLMLAERLENLDIQQSISMLIGVSYDDISEYSNAIRMYSHSLELLEKIVSLSDSVKFDIHAEKAIILNNLGYSYFNLAKYDDALKYYQEALQIAEKKSPESRATILGSISELYFEIGDLKKASEYAYSSLEHSKDLFDLVVGCRMMGDIFETRDMPDSSLFYYNRSFEYAKKQNDNYIIGMSVEGLVKYHLARGSFSEVVNVANYGLKVAEKLGGTMPIVSSNLALARAHLAMGKTNIAFKHAEKALALSIETSLTSLLPDCYDVMELIYLKKEDFKSAYSYRKKMQEAKEQIFNSEKLRYLAEAESLHDLQRKETENQLLKEKQAKSEALLYKKSALNIAALLFIALAITILYFMYRNNLAKKQYSDLLEKEVEKRTAELTNSNIELERFNHIISHDLKEPLRNIVSFSTLAMRRLKNYDDPDLLDYLNFIKKSAVQLNSLIEDVREFTGIEQKMPEQKPVDLNDLLQKVIDTLSLNIQEKKAQIKTSPNLPVINSHHSLLFVLYKNIIENGLKYNESETPSVEVEYAEEVDSHIFSIKDNGIGIPTNHRDEVFEMFKRLHTQNKYNGTGMGLSISKKIAEKLGGDITVKETSDNGTTFQFRIPKESSIVTPV